MIRTTHQYHHHHTTIVTADAGAALTRPLTLLEMSQLGQRMGTQSSVVQRQQPLPLSSLYEPPLFPSVTAVTSPSSSTATTTTTPTKPSNPATTGTIPVVHHPTYPSTSLPVPVPQQPPPLSPQQQQRPLPRTMIQFVQQMYQRQGVRGFYAGVTPALIQIVPYMGCNFAIYDYLTSSTKKDDNSTNEANDSRGNHHTTKDLGKPKISIGLSAYAGSISGAISKMIVYPLDTVKRRLQAQAFFTSSHVWQEGNHGGDTALRATKNSSRHPSRNTHYNGMYDCIRSIYRNEGLASFYRGIVPSVLKTAIATSLTFSCFRWTQNMLHWTHDVQHLRSW